jgi:hypothetical protein
LSQPDALVGANAIKVGELNGLFCCLNQNLYDGIPCSTFTKVFGGITQRIHKSSIMNNSNNPAYNPKLSSADFKTLTINNGVSTFDYDLLKLGNSNLYADDKPFVYYESFAPDVTRTLFTFRGVKDDDGNPVGVYGYARSAMIGLVGLLDLAMPYSKNQLDVFLANNKNFYMQRNIGTIENATYAAGNLVSGITKMAITGGIIGSGEVVSGAKQGFSTMIERIQSNLTLDNMANAPESLYNASGNSSFFTAITECGIYYEIRECIDNEKNQVNDFIRLRGYTYNRIDNIKNVDNIRICFNYVQASVQEVNTPYGLNDEIKNRIRQVFNNGIRLWNKTDNIFNENASNYELRLSA